MFVVLQAVMAGDYILSVASTMLARIRNEEVIVVLSQSSSMLTCEFDLYIDCLTDNDNVTLAASFDSKTTGTSTVVKCTVMSDLVQGEFMQLGSKENENERFAHYLKKTFKKTASLIAYSCKAVAILSGADDSLQEVAFHYSPFWDHCHSPCNSLPLRDVAQLAVAGGESMIYCGKTGNEHGNIIPVVRREGESKYCWEGSRLVTRGVQ
ncbi:Decaprenyl-diphosphate synthase subunit 1 [Portunus trituberculatus]|uniref:Decaprenyl-diphosphate synthase subunit 1 n=1 Tax=Portunus trituberculatus TaxID=210409 RepID=A0A5B7F583_PORTR|nr:Decaprenyl-diphosphate synthase subunit 1 [Portunus trituberculatus]